MKLTKKLEAEMMDVYEAFWGGLLNVDIEIYAATLDTEYRLIGTTDGEVFFNKKEAIKFLKDTADQVAGNIERRKSKIKIESINGLILITEQFDAYALIENKWTFYAKTRVSTWMQKKSQGWKLIQQHFSFPDAKATQGETIGLEKISKENLELREAIKRRTIELENKNRELEIETALERLRAVAMSMRKPEDLPGIGETLFAELKSLGFTELRNTEIIIISDAKETLISYYYSDYGVTGVVEVDYKSNPKVRSWVDQLKKANDAFAEVVITEKEIKAWRKYREEVGHLPDPKLNKAKAVYYYSYSIGMGGLSISTFKPASNEQIKILERFRNVFNLSYQRYIDIAKAEAQVREAQIEAALERVRSRSMAMHQSNDLQDVVRVLSDQLLSLGLKFDTASFAKVHEDASWNLWISTPDQPYPAQVHVPYYDHAIFKDVSEADQKKEKFFERNYTLEEKNSFFKYFFENTEAKNIPEARKQYVLNCRGFARSVFLLKNLWLSVANYEGIPFSAKENAMLQRFANVFEQAYTRFLDLQKAEAQAREARIETALERIRARALAMHSSNELMEVAKVLREQLSLLGQPDLETSVVHLYEEDPYHILSWRAFRSGTGSEITYGYIAIPKNSCEFVQEWLTNYYSNSIEYTIEISGAKQKEWYDVLFKFAPDVINAMRQNKSIHEKRYHQFSKFSGGALLMVSRQRPSEESIYLQRRAALVFDLAYRRFLDLKKAEAQARESQIQLALERVRARTMAMQRSDELMETAVVLFDQLNQLGENIERTIIGVMNEEERVVDVWATRPDGSQMERMQKFPIDEPILMQKVYEAWRQQKKSIVIDLRGEELESYFQFLKGRSSRLKRESFGERRVENFVFFSKGILGIINADPNTPANVGLYERFADVFEQTYTRFLDLQKAEAQARESQIELGLERVRARTMAMQKSDELSETSSVLFHELKNLGIETIRSGVGIFNGENDTAELWLTTESDKKIETRVIGSVHASAHPAFQKWFTRWKQKKSSFSFELTGDAVRNYYETLSAYLSLPPQQVYHSKECLNGFFFPEGSLNVITQESLSEESSNIMLRFARVFGLLYRRFLDLQKAEAQTREAQIELGLERVRARAMAMQKSDELSELVDTVFKELTKLDFALTWCIINIIDESLMSNTVWAANPDINKAPESYHMLFEDYPFHHAMMKGWKERKTKYVYTLEGSEKKIYDDYLFSETKFKRTPEAAQAASRAMEKYVVSFSFSNFGGLQTVGDVPLSDANLNILSRFGKVFDLTYTRFNDLKQAEAQTREAHIEAALEKVRAVAMSMHISDDLLNVCEVLFHELGKLGFTNIRNAIIDIYDDEKKRKLNYDYSDVMGKTISFVPYDIHPFIEKQIREIRSGEDAFSETVFTGQELEGWKEFRRKSGQQDDPRVTSSSTLHYYFFSIRKGSIGISTFGNIDANQLELLKRFRNVFSLSYQRYMDIVLAEAQAREARIELALERVRARTMAMQKSDELAEAASLLFTQIADLGTNSWSSGFIIFQPDELSINSWMSKPDGSMGVPFNIPVTEDPFFIKIYEAYKRGEEFFVMESSGKELEETYKYMFSLPGAAKALGAIEDIGFQMPTFQITHCTFFPQGFLMFITYEPCPEMWDIFKRFGKVFEQTYTRFLDLQKAEAQARESQIQLALERVRARTMAMQKSDELPETSYLLFQQVKELGLTAVQNSIGIVNEEAGFVELSTTVQGHHLPHTLNVPIDDPYVMAKAVAAWKAKSKSLKLEFEGQELKNYNEHRNSFFETKVNFPEDQWIVNIIFFSKGWLSFSSDKTISGETFDLLNRFATVFEQTYIRFSDLKQAEAQVREAKIEAALEKVRSRSLAMHHSDELEQVVLTISERLVDLGLSFDGALIFTFERTTRNIRLWIATNHLTVKINLPYDQDIADNPILKDLWNAIEKGEHIFNRSYTGNSKDDYFRYVGRYNASIIPEATKISQLKAKSWTVSLAAEKNSVLAFDSWSGQITTNEDFQILKRFAKVFEQSYTRFLDLQKAEAQTREAKIEAALEKVRSRTMAMQRSAELAEVATVLFQQVKALGVPQWTCGFSIFEIDDKEFTWYPGGPGGEILPPCKIPLTEHPVFISFNESRKRGDELYIYEKTGEEQADHYRYMCSLPVIGEYLQSRLDAGEVIPAFQIDHLANFSHGNLIFITYEHFPEMHDIFKRFAKVFNQTYTRFLDLQKAEAQAREAIKQASVDRIRAEIASMRTTSDLERITPLVWNELKTLGVPFIRCGVFIIDEEQQQVHTFLSTPDGKANASFTSAFSTVSIITEALPYWRRKEMYKTHWDEATFIEQTKHLVEQGAVSSTNAYLTENRPKDLYLHLLPFLQGILYVGNETPLNDDELQLVQNLADAFAIAYARYEDFSKLELAKEQIENTLFDLKQTQAQLVQSEKMASLGELTAGIAHEIQNPLNFVNNFSEVNKELLAEMNEEIEKGNLEEVKALAKDVSDNEEKINHHGKRADAIVKGMLQHSRSSSGVKEPADINVLADEYLRLAYHGLRAKDKSFNATMKTDYDETIGKINIVPQDVGRSVLNLITNAFYAVTEKKKQNAEGYEPTVTVTTKRINGKVEIRVVDNGNGIPQKVLDKIFQPFFTTKPTGQGTGLGLSLSYDIVKAHNGELKVETNEGEGSEFIIFLPANN